MAVSKEDCIAVGEQLYRNGKERPEGTSWQAKAQQEGYDRVKCKTVEPINAYRAIVSHLRFLVAEAVRSSDNVRSQRLMNKANALAAKHSIGLASVI